MYSNKKAVDKNKTGALPGNSQQPASPAAKPLTDNRPASVVQRKQDAALLKQPAVLQKKSNSTGLPDTLKSGIENLSGHTMDDVKVHYNSSQPAQLNAHAYAQGTNIHLAPGQEKHLPHEAWHVVQQKQGRVRPTVQLKEKVKVNDDKGLEQEADRMGAKAMQMKIVENTAKNAPATGGNGDVLQGRFGIDGKLVSSMKEVAADHDTWQQYQNLSPVQRDIFRDLITEEHVYSFDLLNRFNNKTKEFNGQSGDKVKGKYHDMAASSKDMHLQSNDAEVAILQQVHNYLVAFPLHALATIKITLYVKISKGPCDSCRRLFKEFMREFPGVKVIIQYSQKAKVEKDSAAKDSSQRRLSYGYQDAQSEGAANLKMLHPSGKLDVQGIKGYKATTLQGLLANYQRQYGNNPDFVNDFIGTLSKNLYPENDHAELSRWLSQELINLNRERLFDTDQERLGNIRSPKGGVKVVAVALLVIE